MDNPITLTNVYGIKNPQGEIYPRAWPTKQLAEDFIKGHKGYVVIRVEIREVSNG